MSMRNVRTENKDRIIKWLQETMSTPEICKKAKKLHHIQQAVQICQQNQRSASDKVPPSFFLDAVLPVPDRPQS